MRRKHQENERIAVMLRQLCEAEPSGDGMICRDGGFRYAGDFMSMHREPVELAQLLSDADYQTLLDAGYIEEVDRSDDHEPGVRVTDRGREVAFRD